MQYIDIILQFQIYKKIKLFEKCTKADIKKPSLHRGFNDRKSFIFKKSLIFCKII